jgi:DNA modification methylase
MNLRKSVQNEIPNMDNWLNKIIQGDCLDVMRDIPIFPEQLAQDHILSWSNAGDTVLEPFIGSGTTAIACINTNRNYIGFELDATYCGIANKRIQDVVCKTK